MSEGHSNTTLSLRPKDVLKFFVHYRYLPSPFQYHITILEFYEEKMYMGNRQTYTSFTKLLHMNSLSISSSIHLLPNRLCSCCICRLVVSVNRESPSRMTYVSANEVLVQREHLHAVADSQKEIFNC